MTLQEEKKSSTGKSKADAKKEIIKNLDQLIDNNVAKKKPSETHTGPAEKLSWEQPERETQECVQDELTNVQPKLTTQDKEKHAQEHAQKELEQK